MLYYGLDFAVGECDASSGCEIRIYICISVLIYIYVDMKMYPAAWLGCASAAMFIYIHTKVSATPAAAAKSI